MIQYWQMRVADGGTGCGILFVKPDIAAAYCRKRGDGDAAVCSV